MRSLLARAAVSAIAIRDLAGKRPPPRADQVDRQRRRSHFVVAGPRGAVIVFGE